MSIHAFTSVTCNYLPKARVLAQTLKQRHPDIQFHLVLSDAVPQWFNLQTEPFDTLIHCTELAIPDVDQWLFKHSVVEACTAVKGAAVLKLLNIPGCSGVLYFDPDMALLSAMDRLLQEFDHSAVLLTPHLTEAETTMEAILDNEFSVLRHGIYNLGFVGVKNSPDGRRFAKWWADRLYHFCYDDIPRGIFTDQRWVDLAPACFGGVRILRDPEYNVATWNLTHRVVTGSIRTGILSNGRPLVFYHFSGFDSGAQEAMLKKYGSSMPALFELREWYIAECEKMGQSELGDTEWSYARFDNGQAITKLHRQRFRERADLQRAFPDPYSTKDVNRSYFHWFEANDKPNPPRMPDPLPPVLSSPSPSKTPVTTTNSEHPRYTIVISVCGVTDAEVNSRLRHVVSQALSTEPVCVIAHAATLATIEQAAGIHIAEHISIPDDSSSDADLCAALLRPDDCDLLFVRASSILPQWWDIRLAWGAMRSPGIATISPLDVSGMDLDVADPAIYGLSSFVQPPIPRFSKACVYVRREALRDAGAWRTPTEFLARTVQMRWTHVLADHLCKQGEGGIEGTEGAAFILAEQMRRSAASTLQRLDPRRCSARRQLHIMHSWGGGLEHWVREYCRNDAGHDNLVLKSIGTWGAFGQELRLYRNIDDPNPIRRFQLSPSIKHTANRHSAYRAAIEEICLEYGIDAILVSSLIGHSLDALGSGLPTVMVCHDFYPYCPALNITFDAPCRTCGECELQKCTQENPHNRFFRNVPTPEWVYLREQFSRTIRQNGVRMIAPSPSVIEGYCRLLPELREHFVQIPHGTRPIEGGALNLEFSDHCRLRVVVLGSLAPNKGGLLLKRILPDLLKFADLYLVGCGEWGAEYSCHGVTVIQTYKWEELPAHLRAISPHISLLLSVVPETFSYTLQEMNEMAIPTVATRLGSFADFIQDGHNGFLVDPDPVKLLSKIRRLAGDPAELRMIHQRLKEKRPWRIPEMLARYEAVLNLPDVSATAYFARENRLSGPAVHGPSLQLFWRPKNGSFSEDASTKVRLPLSHAPATAVLRIPPTTQPIASLRLDIDYEAGPLLLRRIRLIDAGGNESWSWSHRHGSMDAGSYFDLEWSAREDGVVLSLAGADPRIVLAADEHAIGGLTVGGLLEVDIAVPSSSQVNNEGARPDDANGVSWPESARNVPVVFRTGNPSAPSSGRYVDGSNAESLLHQVCNLRSRVHELEQSLSWRITTPLRWVGRMVLERRFTRERDES